MSPGVSLRNQMHFHNPVCIDLLPSVADIIFTVHYIFSSYFYIIYINCIVNIFKMYRYSYIIDVILLILHAGIASTDLPACKRSTLEAIRHQGVDDNDVCRKLWDLATLAW